MSDSNPLSILKREISRLGFVSGEKISLLAHFTKNVEKITVAVSFLDDFVTDEDKRTYLRNLISPHGRSANKQKLGNPLFTNILEVVLNLRKALPENLQDDIETMSEEQELEQEELISINTNLIQHPDRKPLAVIMEHVLYVRKSYKDLYRIVTKDKYDPRFLISGTSGVGKSCFLIYLLIRLLCNKTDATVIFRPVDGDLLYCFRDSNLLVGDFKEFSEQLYYNSKAWYLVDGTVPEDVIARTVVSASSKDIKDKRFQHFVKNLVNEFCMPPWSIQELEACRQSVFPVIPQGLMLDLSDEAGGVPRYVLQIPAFIIRQGNPNLEDQDTIDMIKKMSLKYVKEAIWEINNIRRLIKCFSENSRYIELNNHLIHRWPDTFYRERSLSWASGRIFDKIQKKLEDSRWSNIFLKIQDSDDPSSYRGILFESHVLHLFKLGDQTFESRRLEENKNDPDIYGKLTIPTKPATKYIRYASQLTGYNQEGIIIKPTIKSFSAVDLILTPDCIFQITVSPKHPIKQSELIDIVQNMPAYRKDPDAKIFLCFIVPDDIYDIFTYQSYATPKKKVGIDLGAFQAVKHKFPILSNVEQWVVKIKMTPEVTVTSVLNNAMTVANYWL
ncbi:14015_t:CDS:2 [Acaulospora morrowiae]|uniref:14015_t:CDS:1 n=1 Tax=Acaulospora morrowiae TaxID=94023 RepID=A0A9N8VZW7_9GLOM|nr:14015_t:CDS:2 [Acaulospora morrowiae]